ncbi:MAG: glycosyltransferase family 2 protein [Magnetococcales bacterium]|nr:glycosyltransferase family 2 protein [Magnetococcales bacterium]MBF0156123.1 glycosyltransferase family 2 protein [Magnetococcales bacterium]
MNSSERAVAEVAVVIPCYRVKRHVLDVISRIGGEVSRIYCVDDACPEGSGRHVQAMNSDPRVRVLFHEANQGVGGAMITGYRQALADGAGIVVKVDGDGQMDPALIPSLICPIVEGRADYCKGNRFFLLEGLGAMPISRLVGNAGLSFMSKLSTGYWNLFDPCNGYTAIHAKVLSLLPLEKISRGYLFETDMLFRLGVVGAVVAERPMHAVYGDEESNLRISRVFGPFLWGHGRNFGKRIFYRYFLRGFSVASLELVLGLLLIVWGGGFGVAKWMQADALGIPATCGTVFLAALPIIVGMEMLLTFLGFDMSHVPRDPLHLQL